MPDKDPSGCSESRLAEGRGRLSAPAIDWAPRHQYTIPVPAEALTEGKGGEKRRGRRRGGLPGSAR